MRLLPILLIAAALTGCGSITRQEYEHAHGLPAITENTQDGTTLVVYGPDHNPSINPATGMYTCPTGVRVAKFNKDGVMVARWFQKSEQPKP